MRIQIGDTIYEALDVYARERYGDSSIPESIVVYATCYNKVAGGLCPFTLGLFEVKGDKEVYEDCVIKYKELIAAKMLRDGYCTFEFLGKHWFNYMSW